MADWKKYERFVAFLCSEEFSTDDTTVIPNAKIVGKFSHIKRQIDVLIEKKFTFDRSRRVIVDAKNHKRKIDVKDIEEFEGMMRDCNASKGILVCPNGFSEGALRRAQEHISIRVVGLDDLDKIDLTLWEDCLSSKCSARKQRGLILWDSPYGIRTHDGLVCVSCVAKCDACGSFHVWCWGCGEKFALTNEDEHKCGCKNSCDWFWLTAIEEDVDDLTGEQLKAVYLLLPSLRGEVKNMGPIVVDKKPFV